MMKPETKSCLSMLGKWLLAALSVFATVIALIYALQNETPGASAPLIQKPRLVVMFCAWTILPPAWFLLEWYLFERPPEPNPPDDAQYNQKLAKYSQKLADFKYSQELASKIWIAIAVVLGLLIGKGP